MNVRERFNSKHITAPSGCWLWQGHLDRKGRGNLRVNGRRVIASRLSYELHFDVIPDGLYVCHECDNPQCVNPDHLWLGTHRDNTDDMIAKGRHRRCGRKDVQGERNSKAKLTAEQVQAIRRAGASGQRPSDLARQYGVVHSCIHGILTGRTWKHLTPTSPTGAGNSTPRVED